MAFKDTYRLEKVYYENIWTLLKLLKNVDKNNVNMDTVKELLDNAIADNESIIIIYKNLGELYAELQNQHIELGKELEKLRDSLEEFKDEINDKIDENHNYIMGLIREIEQRLDDLENRVEDLEKRMTQAETDIDSLEGRMTTAEGDIDALETAVDGLDDDLTALEGRVDTAEGDIDDLEQNKQDKLTAGSGIAIDPDTNEISNTAQGVTYTAGEQIEISENNIISTVRNKIPGGDTPTNSHKFTAITAGDFHKNDIELKKFYPLPELSELYENYNYGITLLDSISITGNNSFKGTGFFKIPVLAECYKNNVRTNISIGDIIGAFKNVGDTLYVYNNPLYFNLNDIYRYYDNVASIYCISWDIVGNCTQAGDLTLPNFRIVDSFR